MGNDNDDDNFVPYQILDRPIYHMCRKVDWKKAKSAKQAYFTSTFEDDGCKTAASMYANPSLLAAANHFYKFSSKADEDWICLELDPNVLLQLGIPTMVESPTDDTSGFCESLKIRYPHIYGGISTIVPNLVIKVYPMVREKSDGTFLSIPGLI